MIKKVVTRSLGIYLNILSYLAPSKAAKSGFLLFCRPLRAALTPKQIEFLHSGKKSSITFDDDKQIQVYSWGRGPKKIVFLHGWQSHTYRWKNYIESFDDSEYTVYSLDAPGHGLSSGSFLSVPYYSLLIEQFLKEIGEVDALVGHSIGGFSILYTFHRYPLLNVKKVILMAPPGEATDFLDFYKQTLGLSKKTMRLIHDYFASEYNVTPDFFSTVKFASSMNIPGLIIHDRDDAEAPFHYSEAVHKRWPKSKLIGTNKLGHNLRSPEVVQMVKQFIEEPAHVHREPASSLS